jgi:hypothetical protein
MNCESYRCNYLDHDWTQSSLADAVAVAKHLRECAECRKSAEEYDQLRQLLSNTDAISDLGMSRNSHKKAAPSRPRATWMNLAAAMAPAALAACLGWMICIRTQRPALPQQPGEIGAHDAQTPQGSGNLTPSVAAPTSTAGTASADNMQASRRQPPATDIWTAEDVRRGVQVFQEVSATFDGRTSWVALGDRSAEMGLVSSGVDALGLGNAVAKGNLFDNVSNQTVPPTVGDAPAGKPRVFLLRLVLSRGREAKSRTDLVIVAGQNARLELPLEPGRIVRYVIGTTAAASTKLSLWTEVRSPLGGETMAVLATQMQPRSGEAVSAGRVDTASGEYSLEVSFAEAPLPGSVPGPLSGIGGTEKVKS